MSSRLHLLFPGKQIENDWCNFPVPANMQVGSNSMIDSSACFKKFFSTRPIGLSIGSNVTIESTDLATEPEGIIEIGDYCCITFASLVSTNKISIGNFVFISPGVTIVDSDFHPVDAANRLIDTVAIPTVGDRSKRPKFETRPVVIEDDVWIGYNSTILKGVTIGAGSVVEPGSVVLRSVPPGSLVSGNPSTYKPLKDA
jgi:maltose O-acetyltransferase